MCAACVAQGLVYGGGALAGLQVMAAHGRRRRRGDPPPDDTAEAPAEDEPAPSRS